MCPTGTGGPTREVHEPPEGCRGSYEQAKNSLGTATASTIDLAHDLLLYISQREKKSKKPPKYMFTVRNSTSMTVKLIQGVNPMIKYVNMIPGKLYTTLQPLYALSRAVYTATITDHKINFYCSYSQGHWGMLPVYIIDIEPFGQLTITLARVTALQTIANVHIHSALSPPFQ